MTRTSYEYNDDVGRFHDESGFGYNFCGKLDFLIL